MKTNIAIEDYLRTLRNKGHAHSTTDIYHRYLIVFRDITNDKEVARLNEKDLEKFNQHISIQNISPKTKNLAVIAVRGFIKYLRKQKLTELTPELLESFRVKDKERPLTLITREELKTYLEYKDSPRNDLLVNLFYATGLRLAELRSLCIENISKKISIKGKGGRTRTLFIPDGIYESLQEYISTLNSKQGLVFPYTSKHIQRIVQDRGSKIGLSQKMTPHVLRHLYATHLYENGVDLPVLQQLLGHSSMMTTRIYTHVTEKRMFDSYQKYHPLANLT